MCNTWSSSLTPELKKSENNICESPQLIINYQFTKMIFRVQIHIGLCAEIQEKGVINEYYLLVDCTCFDHIRILQYTVWNCEPRKHGKAQNEYIP